MSASSSAIAARGLAGAEAPWLYRRDWDLTYVTLSVVLVAAPYLAYLGLLALQAQLQPAASYFGATVDSFSRNLINMLVALVVGGPHMYATFSRTALDHDFVQKHPRLIGSSLLIPLVVTGLALLNLPLLLTLFFFWASIHLLHQILYITELYNHRQRADLSLFSRLADYGVILTALYPLAAWRMASGTFAIGTSDIGAVVGTILPLGPWMIWLAGGAFAAAAVVWAAKTLAEWRRGGLNGPKTLFIGLTVVAAFFVPTLGNLDTAFQGMNVWHSLQYLALTWMLNNRRMQRGELARSPLVQRLSAPGSARRYYLFNASLTLADVALAGALFLVLRYAVGWSFDFAFDRAYYIAVLSFLWIHYYHDHYLFTQPEVIQ